MHSSHMLIHQQPAPVQQPTAPVQQSTAEKPIDRPEVCQECSEEDWSAFLIEWGHYKRSCKVTDARASDSLYQCCEPSLRRLLIREDPGVLTKSETEVTEAIKQLAVIKKPISIRRTTLLAAKQKHGEPFREFYANVKASALTCNFSVVCHHACCTEKPTRSNTQLASSRTF